MMVKFLDHVEEKRVGPFLASYSVLNAEGT